MFKKLLSITFIVCAFNIFPVNVRADGNKLSANSKVSISAVGPIRVGMTVKQASEAASVKLTRENSRLDDSCTFYYPPANLKGLAFMVNNGRINRIDVTDSKFTTISGAKVGDSESKIKSLYGERIQVIPHKYLKGGHYLIYVPKDATDKNYRIIFETDGKKVTRWRAGQLPQVEFVEGCA